MMDEPKLHIGIEDNNICDFKTMCCDSYVSVEPLSRIVCGVCGKSNPTLRYIGDELRNEKQEK